MLLTGLMLLICCCCSFVFIICKRKCMRVIPFKMLFNKCFFTYLFLHALLDKNKLYVKHTNPLNKIRLYHSLARFMFCTSVLNFTRFVKINNRNTQYILIVYTVVFFLIFLCFFLQLFVLKNRIN